MIKFNADEVFEMAEEIERNGAKFYRKAAESKDGDNRGLLLGLAAMEDEHEKTFAAMRGELSAEEKTPITFDPDNDAALYLRAMADGKVFKSDPSEALSGNESIQDILKTAIGMEKDSVVFYTSMNELVTKTSGKEKVDAIIKEEIGHVVQLTEQLTASKN